MKVFVVHGLGHQEKNPESWQPLWKEALRGVLRKWNPALEVDFGFAAYDDLFGDTPMTVGGTASGFGRLLWNEVRYSLSDKVAQLFGRRRGFGDQVNEAVKWKMGMVTQFAEDEKLRERVRAKLTEQIEECDPDVVFAHSLGTLLTYDLFLHPPQNKIIKNRYFITCGCQIGRRALRSLFGGRLETVGAREWYNLYNKNDDVLVVPFTIYADNFQTVDTTFELPGIGDHDAVEYVRHANAQNKVWREIAGLPRARTLLRRPAKGSKGKAERISVTEDIGEKEATAAVASRTPKRALLVGINNYPNADDRLEGCVNDVFKMSATLQQIGFDPENIRVLLDERATAAAIRERFAWLLEDPQPGDQRVFFYSGHGAQIPDYNSDEIVDHTDETFVPYDFDWNDQSTHLTDDSFSDLYAQLPYETAFVVFLDCCHAGGMTRAGGAKVRGLNPPDDIRHRMLKWNWEDELWEPRQLGEERDLPQHLRETRAYTGENGATNRILRGVPLRTLAHDKDTRDLREREHGHQGPYLPLIFEACSENQYAYEYRDGVTAYGAFTYFMTKALFDAGHARKKLTFHELKESVAGVIKNYYEQTPQLVGPKKWCKAQVPWRVASPTARRRKRPRRKK
ncbi:MAG: caspase family protein [Verrucomicrobiota bacterium]